MIEKFFVTKGSKRTKEVRPFPNIRFHGIEFKKCTPFHWGSDVFMLYFQELASLLFRAGQEMGKVNVETVEEILGISVVQAANAESPIE